MRPVLDVVRGRDPADDPMAGLDVDAATGFNIADVAVDRHVRAGHGSDVALRWIGRDRADLDDPLDFTFSMLASRSDRFASALRHHGIVPGAVVSTVLGRVPDLYIAALGTWKAGCVFSALFASLDPAPLADRLRDGATSVVITTPTLFRRSLAQILDRLPDLELVLICGASEDQTARSPIRPGAGPRVMSCGAFLHDGIDTFDMEVTDPDSPATLHFTGGTTGTPKAVLHPHRVAAVQDLTARVVLDLHAGDTYWCTSDPGWVAGVAYAMTAALTTRATSIIDEAGFDAARWLHILQHQHVDVLHTSPTALRMLHKVTDARTAFPCDLRVVATLGEPLDPATSRWASSFFGAPVLDTWLQTEAGAIVIANRLADPGAPGSMGTELPGATTTVLARDASGALRHGPDGSLVPVTDEVGELAIDTKWPGFANSSTPGDEFDETAVTDGWYRTHDLVRRDPDGTYWFVGRTDEVFEAAGRIVGPFEIEAVLDDHPAVIESAVAWLDDGIVAFVVPSATHPASDELRNELLAHARLRLGPDLTPRTIVFVESLPHSESDKILRHRLAYPSPPTTPETAART